jgi:hypothetical protein
MGTSLIDVYLSMQSPRVCLKTPFVMAYASTMKGVYGALGLYLTCYLSADVLSSRSADGEVLES